MILDPILRFNWIFYAFFSSELQHSALLSFLVGFSEICRRGIWTLFRVENEHCTNVGRFRASRDVPLPYDFPSPTPSLLEEQRDTFAATHDGGASEALHTAPVASGAQISPELTRQSSGSMRRRGPTSTGGTPVQRGIARVGTIMTQAHAQDFERKRRAGGTPLERQATYEGRTGARPEIIPADGGESSSSDEAAEAEGIERDEEGEEEVVQVESIIERRSSAVE